MKKAPFPKLNLPPCRLRVRETRGGAGGTGGGLSVWDALRGRWLLLTPEEWVRRHVIALLTDHMAVPPALIAQEHAVDVNGAAQRADVVVFGTDARPLFLIECKAPGVAIDESTLAQAFRYNTVLGARYVMLTGGIDHYLYAVTPDGYTPLKEFPKLF